MATSTEIHASEAVPFYSRRKVWLIGLCFILSGATGLIYEVLWARMLGLVFGATTLAVSTVLAAFMGGLALGSALAGRFGARLKKPVRAYGIIEIAIALYALCVPFLFDWVDFLYAFIWQRFEPGFFAMNLWRFSLSSALLLLPTTLMGATLPILAAALLRSETVKPTSVARLYTCNLVGAICGVIAAGFVLLPELGVRATIYIAAAVNIAIGLAAIFLDRGKASSRGSSVTAIEDFIADPELRLLTNGATFWLFCAFISGFVTFSIQVAWTRVLTMIIGSSTYAFSIVVALFLIGLSGGAYLVGILNIKQRLRLAILTVELLIASSLVISLWLLSVTPGLLINTGLNLKISTWGGLLGLQIFTAALLILVPAFLMGMVMPLILVWAAKRSAGEGVRLVGRAYAVNTVGAIAGAFCAGFVLIPWITTRRTILLAAALCIVVAGAAYQPRETARDRDLNRSLATGATAILAFLMFFLPIRVNFEALSVGAYDSLVRVLAGTREGVGPESQESRAPGVHNLLMYKEGPTATVSVRKDWDITSLAINGRTNASDREDMPTQVMVGQLPLLVAPNIRNGLIVGFASGVSVGAMLQSPLESLECVELEPATIDASRYFEHVNNRPLADPRLRLIIDDARTYLRVKSTRYDVIVSEPSHPWVPGVANLFTREFFELGSARLADHGVFVQWVQIYQLSTESLRSVLATYYSVFPHVMVFRVGGADKGKDLILLGSLSPLSLDRIQERLTDQRIAAELGRVGLKSEGDVREWYVCDELRLAPAVAGAVINTDDNMHIETRVPREAFLPLLHTNSAWIEMLARQ